MTPAEMFWVGFYGDVQDRYQNVPDDRAVPAMAVRILAKRIGYTMLLGLLLREGAPVAAERCRREMLTRHEFMVHMLARFPLDDPADTEAAAKELARDLAMMAGEAGGMALLKRLDRLRARALRARRRQEVALTGAYDAEHR